MGELSPGQALRILQAAGEIALRDRDGHELAVDVRGVVADGLDGTAPRLAVAGGMTLTSRLVTPSGDPWLLDFVIDEATFLTRERAAVRLRLARLTPDPHRRLAPRLSTGGTVWLSAVNCQDVVDGDRVDGTIRDISVSGVGFSSSRVLRVGDRLMFHARFFSDPVEAEVRVASIRPSSIPGHANYGCLFLEIDDSSQRRIERLLRGERTPSADLSLIHGLVEQQREAHREAPRKRRFFR
jgi:hypothetical protein